MPAIFLSGESFMYGECFTEMHTWTKAKSPALLRFENELDYCCGEPENWIMEVTSLSYDYYGLLATTWDVWRDNTAGWSDRNLFLDVVRQYGEPVLDIGCGTGRIILDFLAQRIDIEGLDNSPEMLAICRTRSEKLGLSPTLHQQRMETMDLPQKYRTILGPSSALQLVTDLDSARETLRRIFASLEPGGAFITPFAFAWREGEPLDTGWQLLFEKPRPGDGALVRSWTREWREPERQWWHTEQRFEVVLNGKVIENEFQRRSPEGRWYSQAEAQQMFRDVGFTKIQCLHDFTHEPVRPEDALFCVLGVKP